MALNGWGHDYEKNGAVLHKMRRRLRRWCFLAAAALVAAAGLGAAQRLAGQADARLREDMVHHAKCVALTINPRRAMALSFSEDDLACPEFHRLSSQMASYAEATAIRNLYTMILRDGQMVFGPESMAEGDPYATPPGTAYQLPPPQFYAVFDTGAPLAFGPYTDEFGTFVSALAPVLAPRAAEVLMAVGVEMEADVWRKQVAGARRIPLYFTAALLAVLAAGLAALEWRDRKANDSEHPAHHAEAVLCAALMLVLTLATAGLVHRNQRLIRQEVFSALARAQAARVEEEIRQVQTGLESLVGFFLGSEYVERGEFRVFADRLGLHGAVEAWVWCPEVSAEEVPAFQQMAMDYDFGDYMVWQEGPGGERLPAEARPAFYPVLYLEPEEGYENWFGFDLGSDRAIVQALEVAQRSGLPTAAAPFEFDTVSGERLIAFVFQPVTVGAQTGFALSAVRLTGLVREAMRATGSMESGTAAGLFRFPPDGQPELVATTAADIAEHEVCWPCADELSVIVPIFAFGKAYGLLVHPEEQWLAAHPLRNAWYAGAAGLALTGLLTALVAFYSSRRSVLAREVDKRTEALQEREAFIRAVLDNLPVGIAVNSTDPSSNFLYMNTQFPLIYQSTSGTFHDVDSFWETVYEDPDERAEIRAQVEGDIASGDPERMTWENVPIKREGEETAFISAQNVPVPEMGLMVSMVRDVTDRKRAEEERDKLHNQLMQAQKMEAVGRLAGGVAHDFNNLLTAIKGYANFVKDDLPEGSPSRDDIEEVLNSADRAAKLTRQLLAFSRRQTLNRETLDMNGLVSGLLKMLGRILGEDVKIEFDPTEGLDKVNADAGQIEQVLMNLAVNARDAMPEGGTLTIETANIELDEMYAESHPEVEPGPYVMLSVSDTGCGMDEETQEHLFEPFFTTKEIGKGTGLGMPMVYGIVKQHGGSVWVYSEPDQGATFKIYLPRAESEEGEEARPETAAAPAQNGTETILLVEDEESVRKLAQRALEGMGYTVLPAQSADEALGIFEKQGDSIALLLTDVVLTDGTGTLLHEKLAAWRKSLKVLFMSGYSADRVKNSDALKPGVNYLQKPFTAEALARQVREVLGG